MTSMTIEEKLKLDEIKSRLAVTGFMKLPCTLEPADATWLYKYLISLESKILDLKLQDPNWKKG